jgi:hypothetical protein
LDASSGTLIVMDDDYKAASYIGFVVTAFGMFAFWLVFILVGVVVMPARLIVVALALFAGFVRGNSGESAFSS